jgi:hypothetical protein
MTWKPSDPSLNVSVDVTSTTAVASHIPPSSTTTSTTKHSTQKSSGTHAVEFTECAALVFPTLDDIATSKTPEAEGMKAKLKHYKGFATEYVDRRAQAEHVSPPYHPHSISPFASKASAS